MASRRQRFFSIRAWGGVIAALLATSAVAASSRATLTGSVPPWATSANFKSATPLTDPVNFRVYLGWNNQTGLEALARAVSDPSNPSYRQFLTPQTFRQQYAPSQANVNAVKTWLTGQGFTVVYTPQNGHYVSAEGTVAQAATAFNVQFNQYIVNGQVLRSQATDLSVPSSLGGVIAGVIGLDQTTHLVRTNRITSDAPPEPAFVNARPCSAYWGEQSGTVPRAFNGQTVFPYTPCGYTPAQLQSAYGVRNAIASGLDGTGQTVAIIDAFAGNTIFNDVNTYSSLHGLSQLSPSQFTQLVAPGTYHHPEAGSQDPMGWYGEETLDVEAVHAMAPGASIVFVGAPNSNQDLDAALSHTIDSGLANIITNSYGFSGEFLPSGFIKPYNDIFLQAVVQGIGLYFSAGDSGDEIDTLGTRSVDWPASSPWVTAVGGTSLGVGAANDYLFETGWGTGRSKIVNGAWNIPPPGEWWYGGGGGTSRIFPQPFYQVGVVPDSIANYFGTGRARAVPDVAALGDPTTGMLVGETQTFPDGSVRYSEYRTGGTSLSSPLFAGMMALADQAAGKPHGFANPALYAAAASGAFRDVVPQKSTLAAIRVDYVNGVDSSQGTTTSLRTLDDTETIYTRPGYDDVTGVGSPNGGAFLSALGH